MAALSGDERGGEPWVLVLDLGSSSVRTWFYDSRGIGVDPGPEAQRQYRWRTEEGSMEADADAILALCQEVIDAGLERARAGGLEIAAVAVTTLWHSIMGLTARGDPATPVYAWGDTRAALDAAELLEFVDPRRLHRRTGCFVHPSYPLVTLRWLRRKRPGEFGGIASWCSLAEYLDWRFFRTRRCSYSMASGSGMLNVHRLRWDTEALTLAGVDIEQLFPLVDAGHWEVRLNPNLARRWPELLHVPWFPALGDGACANVGSGAVGVRRAGVTVGTSAAVRVLWEPQGEVEVPEGLWCYRLDARRWVAGGALSNGGNGIALFRDLLNLPDERDWEAEVAAIEPDSHGLTVLPFLLGERTPRWRSEGRAAVVGLTPSTKQSHLLRAWMEAVAFRIGELVGRLEAAFGTAERVVGSGGALYGSPIWAQIVADVTGRRVTLPVEAEGTARGAALMALEHLELIDDVTKLPAETAVKYDPDTMRREIYAKAARRQAHVARNLAAWTSVIHEAEPESRGGRPSLNLRERA